jgi:hypothetical protein
MPRTSIHREPENALDIARHYIRDVIYGANDGIITTVAVIALAAFASGALIGYFVPALG